MPTHAQLDFLLASSDTDLFAAVEPTFLAAGARVSVVLSAEAVLASISSPRAPNLILLDVELPGMPIGQLLAALRAGRQPAAAYHPHRRHGGTGVDRSPCRGRRRRPHPALR